MGISAQVLSQWEKKEQGLKEENLNGKVRTFTDNQIEFVVNQYKEYSQERKRVKMKAFMKQLRKQWQGADWLTPQPSRKTVEDILIANDLYKTKPRSSKKHVYNEPMKKYFPHVQSVMDGKEVIVSINENNYPFTLEYSKDIASDAICGSAIAQTETADLVKKAFNDHAQTYGKPLSVLLDNGKGNNKAAIDLGGEGTLFIKSWPYRAQSKAPIEGEFSLFEKKVSHIHIEGDDERDVALSILENISKMYIRLRNGTPRCSVCPFTPKKLIQAKVESVNSEDAYRVLKERQETRTRSKEKLQKIAAEKRELLESIIKGYCLKGDSLRFKQSLKWVEFATIKEAEQVFSSYSQKDNFDECKRTMAYFCAIARKLQGKKEQTRKEDTARRRYSIDEKARKRRKEITEELSRRKEADLLDSEPHHKIVNAIIAEMSLPADFRAKITIYKSMIDAAIQAIFRKKRQKRNTLLDKTKTAIMGLAQYPLDVRYKWVAYVEERISQLAENKEKVVTPN